MTKPTNLSLPEIAGTPKEGETLTGSLGGWDDAEAFARQWLANGEPVIGGTGEVVVLPIGSAGAMIEIEVTAYNGEESLAVRSEPVGPVEQYEEPPEPGPPLITTPEDLAAAIEAGEPEINLGVGDFGELQVKDAADLTITGIEGSVFRWFRFEDCARIVVRGVQVDWSIGEGDVAKSSVCYLERCEDVEITGCRMIGEPVPEGTPGAVHDTDVPWPPAGAVVVGYYAGTAINLDDCRRINIHDNLIAGFMQGISHGVRSDDVTIERNAIAKLRTTPIRGNVDHIKIRRNALTDMTPYRYPDNSGGDHLDFIHLWINPDNPPIESVEITENLMDPGPTGFGAIGVFLENNNQPNPGYRHSVVSRNTYLAGETQALTFEDGDLEVHDNVLLAPPGSPKVPTIIFRKANMIATGNVCYDSSVYPELSITHPDNTFVDWTVTQEEIDDARARALAIINS